MRRIVLAVVTSGVGLVLTTPAWAQNVLDRADPTTTEKSLPTPTQPPLPPAMPRLSVEVDNTAPARPAIAHRVAAAIVVDGSGDIPPAAYAATLGPFIGRDLAADDLAQLAAEVAKVARARGFPLATAMIAPQTMADGILRVTVDEGRIDAVRVIGAINPQADRILTRALANGRATRGADLERAIQLVGDLPGVSVQSARFVRQDGFGILLVAISQDRVSGYAQLDNRGSREVGPIRSTVLASVNGLLDAGDELGLIASNTPIQPSEFAFLRARYAAPVDYRGSVVALSASYGRAHPGASLSALDVIGHSVDLEAAITHPLERSRKRSWWASVAVRALKSDQSLLGSPLRDDRIVTVTGSVTGVAALAGGTVQSDFHVVAGLPLAGVSHRGDARLSRSDGDARFVLWGYELDWSAKLGDRFGVVLASAGQLSSRPLLASAEIGLGGPAFGRGYDNAERTGDNGILGSAEVQANFDEVARGLIDRVQSFVFVDGGYVGNLGQGIGGGALLSAGGGLRLGVGRASGMIEVALPLNADRFDTGDRAARVSLRLSRAF